MSAATVTYTATYKLCVCCRLALVLKDIQHLCHFSPGSEAHKRNSLGNDGTIKENRNTNPDSIMEKKGVGGGNCISDGGDAFWIWLYQFAVYFASKKQAVCRLICSCTVVDAHCWELFLMQLISSHLIFCCFYIFHILYFAHLGVKSLNLFSSMKFSS